jgi:L-seryl-tRNA(Ser) seleniumtransferase
VKEYIDLMKKNQLTRALRIDKMTLAALEATLRLYLDEEKAVKEIPGLNMLTKDINTLKKDALRLSKMLRTKLGVRAEIEVKKDFSQVGGGAMPLESMETYVVTLNPVGMSLDKLDYKLRMSEIPVIGRIFKDRMLFDVRTLFADEYRIIAETLDGILRG